MTPALTDVFGRRIEEGGYFIYGKANSGTITYGAGRVESVAPLTAVTAHRWGRTWRLNKNGAPIHRSTVNMVMVERDSLPPELLEVLP